ncbi:iron ABC transporter ATP-binding protein [Snodgrassella alvi]|jgi:iron complex transport system ATP-binding protein|uniref:Iron ABC transporter ATP-binding protein n=1 Tax=Snodgrassella alvi TaxID=1196083 RepID=A0A855FNK5_9NEIS|nr:ATP-binding cassette domain-containing protein [Snodgrassella alvi]PIT46992.1 iron ABC transporter ATP-binding protein [Snodgrassella alvi]PIT59287.1 iron ABC transporter ATP-binding protein [Snodgrassella alvi]
MIHIQNICKIYGHKPVLNNINLALPLHQVTALIGPNGAGKSTLLMILARLLAPTTGSILFEQQDIASIRIADYARLVATLRQSPYFGLRLTVKELVSFGRFPYGHGLLSAKDHQVIDEAIDFVDLSALRDAYIDELSGGLRQMAFLAMTIAQETRVLLLDEPLNNLDMNHAVQIMAAIRRLCEEQRKTVIMVVHDINFTANYADYIVALKHGQLSFCGATREVITEERLSELYGLNFEISHTKHGYVCQYFHSLKGET